MTLFDTCIPKFLYEPWTTTAATKTLLEPKNYGPPAWLLIYFVCPRAIRATCPISHLEEIYRCILWLVVRSRTIRQKKCLFRWEDKFITAILKGNYSERRSPLFKGFYFYRLSTVETAVRLSVTGLFTLQGPGWTRIHSKAIKWKSTVPLALNDNVRTAFVGHQPQLLHLSSKTDAEQTPNSDWSAG